MEDHAPTISAAPTPNNGLTSNSAATSHSVGVPPKVAPLHSPGVVRRKSASSKGAAPSGIVKRPLSTPSIRSMGNMAESSMSLAEKRRNKLGYHRTSVACGHCRKRKIRCLLAAEDAQGRCSNCIRLKKECKFYAVDQQPPTERRPRSGSKTDTSSNELETPHSLSPGRIGGQMVEQVDNFRGPYGPVPTTIDEESGGYHGSYDAPHIHGTPHGMEFPHIYGESNTWEHPYYNGSPVPISGHKPAVDDHQASLWTQSPAPTGYPHLPYSIPPSTVGRTMSSESHSNLFVSAGPREDPGWPPPNHPTRSMSLVQPDELPPHYSNNIRESIPNLKRRKTTPSEVMTPSGPEAVLYSSTVLQEPQSAPLGGPYGHGQPMQFPYPPSSWAPYPQQPGQATMGPPNWYPRSPLPTQLSQVKEDEASTQFHHHSSPAHLTYDGIPGSAA